MRTKSLFGTLLMFLLTSCFTSCSDDDNPENHFELSENSCEVMQGFSAFINLNAHENTTLNIGNSELVDAVYTWGGDGNKAKIEIKGKQKGETNLVVTDNETGESTTIKVKVTEYPMPYLGVNQPKGNIFDSMYFYLYNGNSETINSNDLFNVSDSIVWTVDGVNGSLKVLENEEGNRHLTLKWGHCFKCPGEYKTYLTAWKDNKAVFHRELDVTITDDKDFLAYNWIDIDYNSLVWDTYLDVLNSSPDVITTYGFSGTVPFVEVRIRNSNMTKSYKAFYGYFCKLYSAPKYEDKTEKHKMWQLYHELFSEQNKYSSDYPVAIWVTQRANIVLLMVGDDTGESQYIVYAEPNKQ